MLAAGLKGIEEGYELPAGAEDDVWALTDAERRALGIEPLPANLAEAIAVMEAVRAGRRDARRARLRLLPAQQARRSGRSTASRSPRSSSTATCRCCEGRCREAIRDAPSSSSSTRTTAAWAGCVRT